MNEEARFYNERKEKSTKEDIVLFLHIRKRLFFNLEKLQKVITIYKINKL